jgi:hypothetical protein
MVDALLAGVLLAVEEGNEITCEIAVVIEDVSAVASLFIFVAKRVDFPAVQSTSQFESFASNAYDDVGATQIARTRIIVDAESFVRVGIVFDGQSPLADAYAVVNNERESSKTLEQLCLIEQVSWYDS